MTQALVTGSAPLEMIQLRHHTRNALTKILAHVSTSLAGSERGRRVAIEVERRVLLTAQIADALFGLTAAPGTFEERLCSLCHGLADLMTESDQHVTVLCTVAGEVPAWLEQTVLRVVHEFVEDAVEGFKLRLLGRIEVSVVWGAAGLVVEVIDDGWPVPRRDPGRAVAGALAASVGGTVRAMQRGERMVARLDVQAGARA